VIVIWHETVGNDLHKAFLGVFADEAQTIPVIVIGKEDYLLVDASVENMIIMARGDVVVAVRHGLIHPIFDFTHPKVLFHPPEGLKPLKLHPPEG
jgi:hypothetical protein